MEKSNATLSGIELITQERRRQIEIEGYTAEHDDDEHHSDGELALAAICYAAPEPIYIWIECRGCGDVHFTDPWPSNWHDEFDKRKRDPKNQLLNPDKRTHRQHIRDLVKAGALIAAEIDRLLRLKNL